ncbi:MAG: hypothetical protein V1644_01900 [Candidatus Micrarchaeota archaeon]
MILEKDAAKRERAAMSAARTLAKLHSAGYVHNHLKIGNFVADERGNVKLIDPTSLSSGLTYAGKQEERQVLNHIAIEAHSSDAEAQDRLREKVQREYERVYGKYLGRFGQQQNVLFQQEVISDLPRRVKTTVA